MAPKARKRIAEVAGLAPVSKSGLARIVGAVRDDPPPTSSRFAVKRGIRHDLGVDTPHGCVIQNIELELVSGATLSWPACHPGALLTFLATFSGPFEQCLRDSIARTPPTPSAPWHIVAYADEAATGNLIKIDQTRKAWQILWSFLELGPEYLAHENNWFLLGTLRVQFSAKVKGNISGVFRTVFATFFWGDSDVSEVGFLVRTGDGSTIGPIFGIMGFILADESAFHGIWRSKGSSGNVNCLCCHNNMRTASGIARPGTGLVDSSEAVFDNFDLASDDSVWAMIELLRGTTGTAVAPMEVRSGFHRDLHGLLFDVRLRSHVKPISHTMYDVGHVLFTNGILHFDMSLFLNASKLKFRDIDQEFQLWSWPKSDSHPPKRLFNVAHDHHNEWKGGSSECLSMYQLFRRYAAEHTPPGCDLELASLLSMFRIVDAWKAHQCDLLDVASFKAVIVDHQRKFVLAYGPMHCKPKHHMAMMLWKMLERFKILLSTAVLERRHKAYKEIGAHVKTTNSSCQYELACLESQLNRQVGLMQEGQFAKGVFTYNPLVAVPHDMLPFLPATQSPWSAATAMSHNGRKHHVGDVVLTLDMQVAIRIKLFAETQGTIFICGQSFHVNADRTYQYVGIRTMRAADIAGPCLHKALGNVLHVIPPPHICWLQRLT
jgi:hypothetical protein